MKFDNEKTNYNAINFKKKKTLINKSNIMDVIFYRFYNIKIPLFLYKKHSFGIYINVILLFRLVSFFFIQNRIFTLA